MPKYKSKFLKGVTDGNFEPIYFSKFDEIVRNKAKDKEHRLMLFFAYITGIRPIETKILVRENVSFEYRYIKVSIDTAKRGVRRTIWIPNINDYTKEFEEHVKNMAFPKEYIFPSFVKRKNIRDKLYYMNKIQNIGIYSDNGKFFPFSFYVFRHNILTLLSEFGADFIDLQIFKGARVSKGLYGSAAYYLHRSSERMKKIAKILKKIMTS